MSEEAFVRRFHRDHPGVSTAAWARGRVVEPATSDGIDPRASGAREATAGGAREAMAGGAREATAGDAREATAGGARDATAGAAAAGSSYDRVAAAVPTDGAAGGRVLDLGCGDGFLIERLIARGHRATALIGLDVSVDELARARARVPAAAWLHARAQALPLAAGACAAVVSHLAWTLMPALDAIVAEIERVLAAGGRFVTLVGGGPRGDDAFAGLLDLARPVAAAAPPTPRLGDRRARTDDGLAALLGPARGFDLQPIEDVTIDLSGTAAEVWASLSPSYELAHVAPAALAALRDDFLAAAPRWHRADGLVAATMYARLVTAIRR